VFSRSILSLQLFSTLVLVLFFYASAYADENAVSLEIEQLVKQISEQVMDSPQFKDGAAFAKEVASQEPPLKINTLRSQDLDATENGVNLDALLCKYKSEFKMGNNSADALPSLLVFISSSMPENSLKGISSALRHTDGVLVLQGMIGESLTKTAAFIKELHQQGVRAIIHPKLFTDYQITAVPAFVLHDQSNHIHDILIGNVTLQYALESMLEKGEMKASAKEYLKQIRGRL
jgi:type-F conjugative transfer system pilin assembly protein TrbC